ncbi:MAG: hypothetical protein VX498_00280, partial [Myxococcota bacterium]|nr:hypothetical protein [Myxococcota bacterium]
MTEQPRRHALVLAALAVGGLAAWAVSWLMWSLPLPPNVLESTIPWQVGLAVGTLLGTGIASIAYPALRPYLVLFSIAFVVAAVFVDGALLFVARDELPLTSKGRCKYAYYEVDGLCYGNALFRSHFSQWIPGMAGLGLGTWLVSFVVERARGRRFRTFTAILFGLALAALTLQNGLYLQRSLSGERVRAWNVFHYYLGAKYYPELGNQDLYAAVLAADDDFQARVARATGKKKKRLERKRNWERITKARDLRTYTLLPRDELVAGFDRDSFEPERLRELGRDSRFLARYMGWGNPGWKQCFKDLGFNPAPPWTVIGTPLANLVPLKKPWYWVISNSDLPFYLLAFGLLWWAFGLRTASVMTIWLNCAQLNEARFTGGFLQYDWLVSCLCMMALYKKGKHRSAAVALSWGAMTRVFPGFLILPIVLKAGTALLGLGTRDKVEETGWLQRGPLARVRRAHWNFLVAFTLSCGLLFGASNITGRGLGTWGDWVEKIHKHSTTHPVTSNMRIGVGRLAVHQPRTVEGLQAEGKEAAAKRLAEVPLWTRITAGGNRHRFWSEIPGRDKYEKIEKSLPRRHLLQLIGLPLLLLALLRRRDLDGIILMLFGVFLMVTVSRYYASTWAMLFALGSASVSVP